MSQTFDAFISYNRRDAAVVEQTASELERRGFQVFLDTWNLRPGVGWPSLLEERISDCRAVVVFIGPHGLSSWQRRESYLALERQSVDAAFPVIPALLPGSEDPALGFLGLNTWVDLSAGVSDGNGLDRLGAAIRGNALGTSVHATDPKNDVCPYRGLEAFREEDAPFFFGRETFTDRLAAMTAERSFLAVVGASGSGKSSIVRAGLTPLLRRGWDERVWDVATIRPGSEPLAALVRALDPPSVDAGLTAARAQVNAAAARLRSGEVRLVQLVRDYLEQQPGTDRLLLVVDQFEELATVCADIAERRRFIDLLLAASEPPSPLTVVVTLRSDFYSEVISRRDLMERLENGVVNVGPLSREAPAGEASELEAVIKNPAEAVGLAFESGLPGRILGDVGDEPGNLPLLEYLLTELWRRRERGRLIHAAYDAIGGVSGAIATRAEEAYSALSHAEQIAAKRLFLALVRPGDGRDDTRARATYPEAAAEAEVVDRFAKRRLRLLVTGEDQDAGRFVDLGHETLIHTWQRLREWIEQNRERLRILDRVRARQRRWREEDEPDDLLLPRGLELEEGRLLLNVSDEIPVDEIREFVSRSILAEEARAEAERAREAAERRREIAAQRQKRNVFVAAFVISLLFLAAAAWQWREANRQRDDAVEARDAARSAEREAQAQALRAEAEADLAVARNLAAIARRVLEENPGETSVAAMIAADSIARRNTPEANAVLRDALSLAPLGAELAPFPWTNARVSLSRDGDVAAFYAPYDSSKGPVTSTILRLDAELRDVGAHEFGGLVVPVISPDGKLLAGSGPDRRVLVVDLETGETALERRTRGAYPAFAPDGTMLYAATQTGKILRWDTETWRELEPFSFPIQGARHDRIQFSVSDDGTRLLLLDYGHAAFVVSASTGAVTRLPIEPNRAVDWFRQRHPAGALMTPGGGHALTYDNRDAGALWDLETGEPIWHFDDETNEWTYSEANAFSTDGQLFARGTRPGALILRSAEDGREISRYDHGGEIRAVAFLEEPTRAIAAGEAGVTVWNQEALEPTRRLVADTTVLALAVDSGSGALLIGTHGGRLLRFDPDTGSLLAERRFARPVTSIAAGGTEGLLAVTLWENELVENWTEISFVDQKTRRERSRAVWNGGLTQPNLSADGHLAAAHESATGTVLVWDTASGNILQRIPTDDPIVGFSPDGARLRLDGKALRTIDIETGEFSAEMGEPGGIRKLLAEPYEGVVITNGETSEGSDRRGWNIETGETIWRIPDAALLAPGGSAYAVFDAEAKEYSVFNRESGALIGAVSFPAEIRLGSALSPDGSRLLVARIVDKKEPSGRFQQIELWDVGTRAIVWSREEEIGAGPPTRFEQLPGGRIALNSMQYRDEGPASAVEAIDWATGATLWRATWPSSSNASLATDGPGDEILLSTPEGLELRDLGDGSLKWTGPALGFSAAAFFPDGSRIVVAYSRDGGAAYRLAIVDRGTGETFHDWDAPSGIRDVAVTSDSAKIVAAVSDDDWDGLKVWHAADGSSVFELEMEAGPAQLHPLGDPDLIAVRDSGGIARVFDLRDGAERTRLVQSARADRGAFAAEAQRAVTAVESSIRFWDTTSGEEIARHVAYGPVSSLAISPDGARVAYLSKRPRISSSGAEYEALEIWKPESGAVPETLSLEMVDKVAFDPTGRLIALAGENGTYVRLVDSETLQTTRTFTPSNRGSFELPSDDWASFTGDGRHLILAERASYNQGTQLQRRTALRAFDIDAGEDVARFDVANHSGGATAGYAGVYYTGVDGRMRWTELPPAPLDQEIELGGADALHPISATALVLATDYWGGDQIVDLVNGRVVPLTLGDETFNTLSATVDPQGRYVALSRREADWSEDSAGLVIVYDAATGEELARTETPRASWGVAFADGGDALLLSRWQGHLITREDQEGAVLSWSWREKVPSLATLVDDNPVSEFATSADGSRFVTSEGGENSDTDEVYGLIQVRLWDANGGSPLLTATNDLYAANVALSADGRRLAIFDAASPTKGEVIELTEAGDPKRLLEVERSNEANSGRPLGFAQDGEVFILSERSGARIYELGNGVEHRLREPESTTAFALSPDGALLAMGGAGFVSVWNVARRERVTRFAAEAPRQLAFAGADGRTLLARSTNGVLELRWRTEELAQLACRVYAADRWFAGRLRLTGLSEAALCDPAPIAR